MYRAGKHDRLGNVLPYISTSMSIKRGETIAGEKESFCCLTIMGLKIAALPDDLTFRIVQVTFGAGGCLTLSNMPRIPIEHIWLVAFLNMINILH